MNDMFHVKVNTKHEVEESGPAPFGRVPYMKLVNRVAVWLGSPNAPETDCVEACLYARDERHAAALACKFLDDQVAQGLAASPPEYSNGGDISYSNGGDIK